MTKPKGPVIIEYDAPDPDAPPGPAVSERAGSVSAPKATPQPKSKEPTAKSKPSASPKVARQSAPRMDADVNPAAAPPVPDIEDMPPPEGRAMVAATRIAARRMGWFGRLAWGAITGLFLLWLGTAAWDFGLGLIERNLWLGRFAMVLGAIVAVALLVIIIRELSGFARLSRLDAIRKSTEAALSDGANEDAATDAMTRLIGVYGRREDLRWQVEKLKKSQNEVMDPQDRLAEAERALMTPLDAAAQKEIETAARQVATVTAIVPLALADVATALTANVRMVRRIAEVYGGRSGTLGSWRLVRAVATHLIATGAVGVADDLIGSVAGGGAVAKLSRRFGEGIINGALTARVGVAAMDVCRPMPFTTLDKPSVTDIIRRALTGMFSKG